MGNYVSSPLVAAEAMGRELPKSLRIFDIFFTGLGALIALSLLVRWEVHCAPDDDRADHHSGNNEDGEKVRGR